MPRKSARRARADGAREIAVRIAPQVTENTPFYYCNYVSVMHSRYEFTLNLLRVPALLTREQEVIAKRQKPLPIEAALQVVVPPQLIPGLINALSEQKRRYETHFGKIE